MACIALFCVVLYLFVLWHAYRTSTAVPVSQEGLAIVVFTLKYFGGSSDKFSGNGYEHSFVCLSALSLKSQ